MRLMMLSAVAALAMGAAGTASARPIDGQYICVFKADRVSRANVRAEAERASGGGLRHVYEVALKGFALNISSQGVAELRRRNPNIAYCEQDQEVTIGQTGPLDFRTQARPGGGGTAPGETVPWGVSRVKGGVGDFKTSTRRAFVIDSGIDLDHPDLRVDVGLSRNFVPRDTSPDDLNGHGTHVAGTIGAIDNNVGVVGVAPGARLVAVRVLDRRGSGAYSDVIKGVDYVATTGQSGDVANMSLGGPVSDALDTAVSNAASKGIYFTLAAGNSSTDANTSSPARANGNNIFTVSSFAQGDRWSSFSNYGNPPVDHAEPGSSIPSTYKDGGYATLSGTSMAAPHLAGILYATGNVAFGGYVTGDPDGKPDIIGVR